jgi:pimeloyl-ACP methyl ester carboxylesterase
MQMHAAIQGAQVWFEDTGGDGAPVAFLHAGSGSSLLWKHQLPAFAAAGYRAIAYDRRGHGRTVGEAGAASSAADELLALLDHLGIARAHVVGTAAGGIAAFDFALSFPERTHSLVVANSHAGVQDADYLALQRRLRPPAFDALPAELRELGPCYRAAHPEGVHEWTKLEPQSVPGGVMPKVHTRNHLTFAALATISAPLLLITGDADLYIPPPVLDLFLRRLPHARSTVIPACGHSAYWEQPDIFNNTVIDFLRSVSDTRYP